MTDTAPMPSPQPFTDVSDDALDWQVLLHSGNATPQDRARYQRWCLLSQAHAAAAEEAEALWQALGHTQSARTLQPGSVPRHSRRWAVGIAACLLLAIAGLTGMQRLPVWTADYHTGVGQLQTLTLADGSRVTLNSATVLDVMFTGSERRIKLQAGEALFETTDDSRPFVVQTAHETVQGRAATFSVRDNGEVVLAQGELRRAEQPLAVTRDASARMAWRRGKLIFNGKPLGQVLTELERYQHGRIVLSDPRLAALQVSGVFDLNEPQALLRTLEQRYGLEVTYLPWLAVVH
ncbi:FecR domain-containing protein [Pseudomonas sp.]|uniref:FecR family protein n=1 Tax=Pseudomonas sp. TaxID=306 RepID=UPI0028A9F8F4|nr:FecR domain-containing protein [Pseudomonas sp.]